MGSKLNEAQKEAYVEHHQSEFKTNLELLKTPVDVFQGIFHVGLTIWAEKKIYGLLKEDIDIPLVILGVFIAMLGLWLIVHLNNVLTSLMSLAYARVVPGSFHSIKVLPRIISWFITLFAVFTIQGLLRSDRVFF